MGEENDVSAAVRALAKGDSIVLLDRETPQPKSYLVQAASLITPDRVAVMVSESRSVICAAVSESRLRELGLPSMVPSGDIHQRGVEFSISVEARSGVTTGISAADRAQTLRTLACTTDSRRELVTPGHIFPVRAKNGGVLVRADAPEAATDLLVLGGLPPVAAMAVLLDEAGELLALPEVTARASERKIPVVAVTDVIAHRLAHEQILEPIARAKLPTTYGGMFDAVCFRSKTDGSEHLALVKGDINRRDASGKQLPLLVRVQSEQRFGDLLGFLATPGWRKIQGALRAIDREGRGVFVYIRHPRRGILMEQIRNLETAGPGGAAQVELREFGIGAQILQSLGVERIRLMSSGAKPAPALDAFNIEIVEQCPFNAFSDETAREAQA